MRAFWHFAKHLLHEKATLFWAMVFAFLSASGLAVGLLTIGPILALVLDPSEGKGLPELAREFNAEGRWIEIPAWVVDRLPSDPLGGVTMLMVGIAIITVAGGIANFLHQYLSQTVVTRAIARIRQDAFDHVLFMPLVRVMSRGASELVARIVRDAAELQRGLIALVSKAVTSIFKGLAALAVALYVDWKLTLVAVPTALLLGVILRKLGKRIRRGTRGSLKAQEGLLRVSTEVLQGLRSVKANTAEAEAQSRFEQINREAVRHELKVRTARALSGPIAETLATFVILVLGILAARSVISGARPVEQLTLALGSLAMAGASMRPLTGLINEVQAATAPAERLADLMVEAVEGPAPVQGRAKPQAAVRHSRSIEFEDVSFTYPGAEMAALQSVSLNILHGERVAIVGPNGCGKTTLLSLVPRLLIPDSGCVSIDGHDIAEMNLQNLRRQIGVVTQETVLFRGSIASNIAFGLDGATRQQIIEAAKGAHADEFISSIPGGYDADVLEQGASLSGGQRQRLAIARAILRDPAILILDEATSQIDAESEAHINQALAEFCKQRTALLIAHRLSTVLNADRIVVMDTGRIIDQGRHEQLLERCELYRRLSRTQLVAAE
ncbi:MAG: ABC transporter ATP-binding protein/permease [Phycisphaerales bacterium]|nr:ABC transporter ATP-binding protein/permease [Phycisphaerales bacterium]